LLRSNFGVFAGLEFLVLLNRIVCHFFHHLSRFSGLLHGFSNLLGTGHGIFGRTLRSFLLGRLLESLKVTCVGDLGRSHSFKPSCYSSVSDYSLSVLLFNVAGASSQEVFPDLGRFE